MQGSQAKRGTHGLRKRCPVCRKLRKFYINEHRINGWRKKHGHWVCGLCVERGFIVPDDNHSI